MAAFTILVNSTIETLRESSGRLSSENHPTSSVSYSCSWSSPFSLASKIATYSGKEVFCLNGRRFLLQRQLLDGIH